MTCRRSEPDARGAPRGCSTRTGARSATCRSRGSRDRSPAARARRTPRSATSRSGSRLSGGFRYSNHPRASAAARRLRHQDARRLLPVLRRRDGADAPLPRHPGPRRGRLRERHVRPRSSGVWSVTDHDAHAWVEVWFRGYGWLPFDPTPPAAGAAPRQARGRLQAPGSGAAKSASAAAGGARAAPRNLAARAEAEGRQRIRHDGSRPPGSSSAAGPAAADRSRPVAASPRPARRCGRRHRVDEARLAPDAERSRDPRRRRGGLPAGARRVPRRPANRRATQRDAR